jgi:hypothetical protein
VYDDLDVVMMDPEVCEMVVCNEGSCSLVGCIYYHLSVVYWETNDALDTVPPLGSTPNRTTYQNVLAFNGAPMVDPPLDPLLTNAHVQREYSLRYSAATQADIDGPPQPVFYWGGGPGNGVPRSKAEAGPAELTLTLDVGYASLYQGKVRVWSECLPSLCLH